MTQTTIIPIIHVGEWVSCTARSSPETIMLIPTACPSCSTPERQPQHANGDRHGRATHYSVLRKLRAGPGEPVSTTGLQIERGLRDLDPAAEFAGKQRLRRDFDITVMKALQ